MSNVLVVEGSSSQCALQSRTRPTGRGAHGLPGLGASADGMNVVRTEPLDAIILDLQLPDGDGLQFLRGAAGRKWQSRSWWRAAMDTVDERILGLDSEREMTTLDEAVRLRRARRPAAVRSSAEAAVVSDSVLRHDDLQIDLLTRKSHPPRRRDFAHAPAGSSFSNTRRGIAAKS